MKKQPKITKAQKKAYWIAFRKGVLTGVEIQKKTDRLARGLRVQRDLLKAFKRQVEIDGA